MKKKPTGNHLAERILLTLLSVVLGIVLAVLIVGTVYVDHLLNQMNYVDPDATVPTLSAQQIEMLEKETDPQEPDPTAPVITEEDVDFGSVPVEQIGGDDIINILLIGQDTRGVNRARSDTMILCTFNKLKNTITLTSFMRDMYVQIPGYSSNRINTAYYLGGMPLLDETLYVNFGVEVDGNVEVDFNNFKEIINLLGGVTIDLTQTEANFINARAIGDWLSEGSNRLTGSQALWYARNRSDGQSDFGRTNRQRNVINALIEEYKSKKLSEMLGIMSDVLPYVTTDMTKSQITGYAVTLFPMLTESDIVTQRIPVDDGFYNATIDGMSVLVPYREENIQALLDSLT